MSRLSVIHSRWKLLYQFESASDDEEIGAPPTSVSVSRAALLLLFLLLLSLSRVFVLELCCSFIVRARCSLGEVGFSNFLSAELAMNFLFWCVLVNANE
mgnify:CR=1 FL=1|tara:strand:- start:104 stop:400 length:297 start_codon:yes stop_codon:yes gene_type:complete